MGTVFVRLRAFFRRLFFRRRVASRSQEFSPDSGSDHALVVAVTSPRRIPSLRQLRYAGRVLSTKEQRNVLLATIVFLAAGGLALGFLINDHTDRVPAVGGSVSEALVGEPTYLNPLDAPANDVDRDLSSLIYSGLFRMDGMDPVPDLAESYSWSDDGKTLTVTLRDDAYFQDGNQVTADDVQFTVESIQDPARACPLAPQFRGVKAVATDARTIQFIFDQPDATFLAALTVGILPADLWQDITAENARLADLNMKPVGSGPYRFKSFTRDSKGLIRTYTLERSDQYYGTKPYVKTLVFQFYSDRKQAEDALRADLVDALAFSSLGDAKTDSSRWHHVNLGLPQETVAFFNIKQNALQDERVRTALAGVVDRQEVVDAWGGHAVPVSDPYPYAAVSSTVVTLDEGRALLDAAGWVLPKEGNVRIYAPKAKAVAKPTTTTKKTTAGKTASAATVPATAATSTPPTATASSTELALTLIVPDQPELAAIADILMRRWSLLGVKVTVETLDPDAFLRRATRDRDEDVALTDVLLGPDQDLYPFWWSGQASDRGLDISGLADRDVDAALEATRNASSTAALQDVRSKLSSIILKFTPAIFLVRPSSPYLVSRKIQGVSESVVVSRPSDRFNDLMHWYVKTGWRWK